MFKPSSIPPPKPSDDPLLAPLLDEPFASLWSSVGPSNREAAMREQLLEKVKDSHRASLAMHTARVSRLTPIELADGVKARTLYLATPGVALRPGEPVRVQMIDLAPGSRWTEPSSNHQREWLVLRGQVQLGEELLGLRDHQVAPLGWPCRELSSSTGAQLFLRESLDTAPVGQPPRTVRDEQAGWPDFVPGIQRRVMWQQDGAASMLYLAQPGANIPLHSHGHDEECLMVQGELYLDDVLLMPGDYQLAPSGTRHHTTHTPTGVVLYAHGDANLKFES
jgi:quercetin dioxygenase-like cupin family protein